MRPRYRVFDRSSDCVVFPVGDPFGVTLDEVAEWLAD
jgi:hypothetical protein